VARDERSERVRGAHIALEQCNIARVPVGVYTRRDNVMLWWLPLVHNHGRPYTRHSATLVIDQRRCAP